MDSLYSKISKEALIIAAAILFCVCFAFIKADVVGPHAVYDKTEQHYSYDKDRKKSYVNNVIKVSFEPFRIVGEEKSVSDYVGGSYYRDPDDENKGYIVLPGSYTMAELTSISDDILSAYAWVTSAGYILD